MSINLETNQTPAGVDAAPPEPVLTPEEVVDLLRATRAKIGEVAPMTARQRRALRRGANSSNPIVQASINVIDALDIVSLAVGQPAPDVRQLWEEANRWTAVEDELRGMLNGVIGANLLRRHQVAVLSTQAYNIGAQLARNPAFAVLVPHVQEIKRLRSFKRRKKTAAVPAAPQPSPTSETP